MCTTGLLFIGTLICFFDGVRCGAGENPRACYYGLAAALGLDYYAVPYKLIPPLSQLPDACVESNNAAGSEACETGEIPVEAANPFEVGRVEANVVLLASAIANAIGV